jgi:putative addiction module killer protein
MIEIIQSETFRRWVTELRDRRAQAVIAARLLRMVRGSAGDTTSVGEGVHELRIHFGPGYRLYYVRHGPTIVILLCGGDKGTQTSDIQTAKQLARQWRKSHG